MDKTKDEILDHKKYFKEEGDPGFNPARNKWVVENSIRKNEALQRQKSQDWVQQLGRRSQAVAFYLKHLNAGNFTSVEKYFGRKALSDLQGKRIVKKLQRLAGVNKSPVYTLEEI